MQLNIFASKTIQIVLLSPVHQNLHGSQPVIVCVQEQLAAPAALPAARMSSKRLQLEVILLTQPNGSMCWQIRM